MLLTIFKALILPAIALIISIICWILLYKADATAVNFLNSILSKHYVFLGLWLALLVIGVDYLITLIINGISYRNVGSKSKAQYYQSKD